MSTAQNESRYYVSKVYSRVPQSLPWLVIDSHDNPAPVGHEVVAAYRHESEARLRVAELNTITLPGGYGPMLLPDGSVEGEEKPFVSKFAEVLSEIPEGDERDRATHAAMVYRNRVGGMRPSDAARTIVREWRAGRLDTWEQIRRDSEYRPTEEETR